jgi:hypothetical protein
MNENIKKWYLKEYQDNEGNYIDKNATFQSIFDDLDHYRDIYPKLAHDSIIRERVFKKLSEIIGTDYDYIYQQLLLAK